MPKLFSEPEAIAEDIIRDVGTNLVVGLPLELGKANHIKVVLSSILPVSEYHVPSAGVPQTTRRPMARIRAINEWMKKYAAAEGHVYLDYFPAMIDDKGLLRSEFSADDLHPNAAGYAAMAPLAEAAIQKALK